MHPRRTLVHLWGFLRYYVWYRPLAALRRIRFYVDPHFGDDHSPGTEERPVRTCMEVSRRIRTRRLQGDIVIYLVRDVPMLDWLNVNVRLPYGARAVVSGIPSPVKVNGLSTH